MPDPANKIELENALRRAGVLGKTDIEVQASKLVIRPRAMNRSQTTAVRKILRNIADLYTNVRVEPQS